MRQRQHQRAWTLELADQLERAVEGVESMKKWERAKMDIPLMSVTYKLVKSARQTDSHEYIDLPRKFSERADARRPQEKLTR